MTHLVVNHFYTARERKGKAKDAMFIPGNFCMKFCHFHIVSNFWVLTTNDAQPMTINYAEGK